MTYDVEVADRDVVEGEGDGDSGPVSGQFTMPDLGGSAKSVTVEAVIRDDGDDKTTVKRKLQYLGPAIKVEPTPAPPAPVAAPAAPQQAVTGPAPAQGPAAAAAPSGPDPGGRAPGEAQAPAGTQAPRCRATTRHLQR